MQKRKIFCSLIVLTFIIALISEITQTNPAYAEKTKPLAYAESLKPLVYVDPPTVKGLPVGASFNVTIKIANVTNLYGVDIRFRWNPTILEYVSHSIKIPVDDYPDGILYKPIMPITNKVNATAGTYQIAQASMLPAPSFNGSGIVFTIKLKVKSIGRCLLDIYSSDLSGKMPPGPLIIIHDVQDGYFSNFVPPQAKIYVTPSKIINSTLEPCSNFTISVNLENVIEFDKFEFWLRYNTTILDTSNVTVNPMFPSNQSEVQIFVSEGKIRVKGWLLPLSSPFTGNLPLASIIFHVTNIGASVLDLYNVTLVDAWNEAIPYKEPGDGLFNNMLITRLYIDPPQIIDPTLLPPMTFTIRVKVENAIGMYGYEFKIGYNTAILNVLGALIYPPTNDTGFTTIIRLDDPSGNIWIKVQYYPPSAPITIYQATTLAEIVFQVQSLGATVLDLHDENLTDPNGGKIPVNEVGDGFFMSLVRDVAILNVTATPNKVYPGRIVKIDVLAKNLGNGTAETFNVTVYYDDHPIGTQTVINLDPQANVTLTFFWNTTGLEPCHNFTLRAEASQVPYEIDVENNVFIGGWVKIKIIGDIDGNGKVDIYDIALATVAYGSHEGDPNWNPDVDVAPQWGVINIYDVVTISFYYGQGCS
jgi:hypothetical protein